MKNRPHIASLGLIVFLPLASMAHSDCPTRSDLENNGIGFVGEDSTSDEVHRLDRSGAIEITRYPLEIGYRNVSKYGVHLLSYAEFEDRKIDPSSTIHYSFDVSTSNLPEPIPESTWSASTTSVSQDGKTTQTVHHSWGELTQFTIGDCTLEAIPIFVSNEGERITHYENFFYFPALGTAILPRFWSTGEWSDYDYTFSFRAISAL